MDQLPQILDWYRDGEQCFADALAATPIDPATPSALPDWTRGHLLAHLTGNADALRNLVAWAASGVETPMYASPEARSAQIERDRAKPEAWLREQFTRSSSQLRSDLDALSGDQWSRHVRSAQGRDIDATAIPWMRARETFVHLVDLDVGRSFDDLPESFVQALLDEATAAVGAKPDCPPVLLVDSASDQRWSLGPGGSHGERARVTGTAAQLLRLVLGRDREPEVELPRWL